MEAEAGGCLNSKSGLVYRVSSSTTKAVQRDLVSSKQTKNPGKKKAAKIQIPPPFLFLLRKRNSKKKEIKLLGACLCAHPAPVLGTNSALCMLSPGFS